MSGYFLGEFAQAGDPMDPRVLELLESHPEMHFLTSDYTIEIFQGQSECLWDISAILLMSHYADTQNWNDLRTLYAEISTDATSRPQIRACAIFFRFFCALETLELPLAQELFNRHNAAMQLETSLAFEWRTVVARYYEVFGLAREAHASASLALKFVGEKNQKIFLPAKLLRLLTRTTLRTAPKQSLSHLSAMIDLWRANFDDTDSSAQEEFLSWATETLKDLHWNDRDTKTFRARLTSEMSQVVQILESPPFNLKTDFLRRAKLAVEMHISLGDPTLTVDATEVGNEARFANHADIPNATLRGSFNSPGSAPTLDLIAIDAIGKGEEVTIHYGGGYWKSLNMEISSQQISDRKPGEAVPPSEWRGCLFSRDILALDERDVSHVFQRYVGRQISDDTYFRLLNKSPVQVEVCPPSHPSYPGFRLIARKSIVPGERICVYAGVLRVNPEALDALFSNAYTSHVNGASVGVFGFTISDFLNGQIIYSKDQAFPVLAKAQNSAADGRRSFKKFLTSELHGIETVGSLSKEDTRQLLELLKDEAVVDQLEIELGKIPDLQSARKRNALKNLINSTLGGTKRKRKLNLLETENESNYNN